MNEISISFIWRSEKAFFGTESAPAAGVMGSRIRQQGRLLELDVLTGGRPNRVTEEQQRLLTIVSTLSGGLPINSPKKSPRRLPRAVVAT